MKRRGFTVVEVIIALLVVGIGAIVYFNSQATVAAASRDTARKTSINAIYYALENSFYKTNSYYPATVSSKNLPMVDPSLFNDPSGVAINAPHSTLHYQPTSCNTTGHCRSYTLTADLEREATYTKDSIHS